MNPIPTSQEAKNLKAKLEPELRPTALVRKSTIIYTLMSLVGLAFLQYGHKTLKTALPTADSPLEFTRQALIGGLGAVVLLVLSYFFEDWFASFRTLKTMIMRLLGPCSVAMALYLSLITAFGEELLFRGALQPFLGLALTSVLFGLLHMGQGGVVSAWSVWAMIAGLLLGWMFQETGSLWPPIVAHIGVNAVSILTLRRAYRGFAEHLSATGRGSGGARQNSQDGQDSPDSHDHEI